MSWGIVATVGASVVSGAMSANAAGDAADAQVASGDRSLAEQRRQFDLNREDLAPFMRTGVAANQRLAQLLGIAGPGGGGGSGGGSSETAAQVRARLLPKFTTMASSGGGYSGENQYIEPTTTEVIDEPALQAAIKQAMASQGGGGGGNPNAADFGSLLKRFSTADLNADPVYQSGLKFGLNQGTEAINSRAIAGGNYDSGATLKALTRFGNDYGSTKANEAFNRYNITNDSIYNKLAGVSGAGQQATNQAVASGTSMSQNIGNTLTDAGNARAAGIVGGANAWGDAASGISGGVNNYNTNEWLKSLTKKTGTGAATRGYTVPTYEGAEY